MSASAKADKLYPYEWFDNNIPSAAAADASGTS